ncbi:hypothetical protein D3C76_250600 [compost metagenome]
MRTVSFQGADLSQSQRAMLRFQDSVRASQTLNSSLFDVPATVPVVRESREDREARRYWEIVAEFKRFSRTEFHATGTPFVGDAFGF